MKRMSRRHLRLAVSALLAVLLLLAACGRDDGQTPAQQGDDQQPAAGPAKGDAPLTLAMWSEPSNMNPWIRPTAYDAYIHGMVFNGLVKPGHDLSLEPDLAERWEWSADGRTITFYLRDGVKWHDGEPFTAEDVAFTLNAAADPGYDGGFASVVAPIEGYEAVQSGEAETLSGIEVVSPTEIRITLSAPSASFLAGMTHPILPEHVLRDVPVEQWATAEFSRKPIGTGPFMFDEWRSGQYIRLAANPDYFEGRPKTGTVIWRFGDQNTMLASFLNGEVHVTQVPIDSADLVASGDSQLVRVKTPSFQYMGMNLADPRLADPAVRRAMAHAIDKTSMVNSLLHGYGTPLNQLFPEGHWTYDPSIEGYAYDVERARAILDEAGWVLNEDGVREKDGQTLTFTLIYPTGNLAREKSAPLIQQNLAEIGIKVELEAMDLSTLISRLLPRNSDGTGRAPTPEDYTLMLLGFSLSNGDPQEYMPYFHSKDVPPAGYNYTNYADPEIDALFEQQAAATDHEKRVEIFHQINRKLSADVPWIPLYMQEDLWAVRGVEGFNPTPTSPVAGAVNWVIKR